MEANQHTDRETLILDRVVATLAWHRSRIAHLQLKYDEELAKSWRVRSKPLILFLWKEMSVHQAVIDELQDVLGDASGRHD